MCNYTNNFNFMKHNKGASDVLRPLASYIDYININPTKFKYLCVYILVLVMQSLMLYYNSCTICL